MEQRRYGFNKEQGTKGTGGRVARSFPFIYFTVGRGERKRARFWSYLALGVGDLWAQDGYRRPMRSPDLFYTMLS